MRRQKSIEKESPHHIKHGDLVSYCSKTSGLVVGYVSAIRKTNGAVMIKTFNNQKYGGYSYKKVKVLYRFSKIYFIEGGETVA